MSASLSFVVDDGDSPESGSGVGLSAASIVRLRWITTGLIAACLMVGMCMGIATPPPPETGPSLETIAQSYAQCMRDAGITAKLSPNPQGDMTVVMFPGDLVLVRDPNGMTQVGASSNTDFNNQALIEFYLTPDPRPMLVIDGVDHTGVFLDCLKQTGYDWFAASGEASTPEYPNQADIVDQWTSALLQSGTVWAECARAHGWPDVENPVKDDMAVQLPYTITEDQLRALLGVCPNFDPIEETARMNWVGSYQEVFPPGYTPPPIIGFQVTGLAVAYPHGLMPESQIKSVVAHLHALTTILNQEQSDFYSHGNTAIILG